jgi:hypothetical protein
MKARLRRLLLPALALGCLVGCAGASDGSHGAGRGTDAAAASQWFTEITGELGIDFVHDSGARGELWVPEIVGPGAAMLDYDEDGDLDLYFVNGNRTPPQYATAAEPLDRLYRQEPGGRFRDVTAESGLGDGGYGMGVAVGDVDNDGWLDVFVTNLGSSRLYRNRGDGTFQDVTESAGISVLGWSCSAAFLDYDLDGWLDLYVTRYVRFQPEKECYDNAGRRDYCGPLAFLPETDVLLHNDGNGRFRDVTEAAGIDAPAAAGLGVVVDDLDGDGWSDIYVANDGYANHLYMNQRDGTFDEVALLHGVAFNMHGRPEAGMGVVAADFDGDTRLDLFVTNLTKESNTMYRQLADGRGFADLTGPSNLGASSMEFTGFGVAAFDVELDGDLDLFVGNGRVLLGETRPNARVRPPWDRLAEPNLLYLNDGRGRFEQAGPEARDLVEPVEITRATAFGDLDADGDVDLALSHVEGPARVYRNDVPRRGSWLQVRAFDEALRRDAIGARVTVSAGERVWVRTISTAAGYLAANDPWAHFGLGAAEAFDQIDVQWPGGTRERFPGGAAGRRIRLVRGTGERLP